MNTNVRGGWASRSYYTPCQDHGGFGVGQAGIVAAVVADGVSNAWHSEIASRSAVKEFLARITSKRDGVDADFYHKLFADLTMAVREQAETETNRQPDQWPATTLLAAVYRPEANGSLTLTYVGDGAIWLVRGDRQAGIPLLLPTANRLGALQGILHPLEEHISPVVIQLEGNVSWSGGWLVVIATDGVPLTEGRAVKQIVDQLSAAFDKTGAAGLTERVIGQVLQTWLQQQRISDDATIAVLLSPDTLALWEVHRD
jgi:hypothetical protein